MRAPPNDRTKRLVTPAALLLCMGALAGPASAADDALQKAIHYIFTSSEISEGDDPCVVVVTDTTSKRSRRYYLSRFKMDVANINKTYSGRSPKYSLDIRGDETIVEYLGPDRATVLYGNRAAQIDLPGDIDQINKALQIIDKQCTVNEPPRL